MHQKITTTLSLYQGEEATTSTYLKASPISILSIDIHKMRFAAVDTMFLHSECHLKLHPGSQLE